ncbi:hypothetical protein FK516_28725 [Klebsiella pneumoniae]|nr:hypothetical protein [Klebsiella pneumoniae]
MLTKMALPRPAPHHHCKKKKPKNKTYQTAPPFNITPLTTNLFYGTLLLKSAAVLCSPAPLIAKKSDAATAARGASDAERRKAQLTFSGV